MTRQQKVCKRLLILCIHYIVNQDSCSSTANKFKTFLAHSFASYDAKNEYRGDRNVGRKLLTVDGKDNFHF